MSSKDSLTPDQSGNEHTAHNDRNDDQPVDRTASPDSAQAHDMTAQELEKLQLSGKFDRTTDPARLEAISPHPPGDQVDRTVVAGEMIKSASLWAIRLVVIGFFLYLLGEIIGSFWQGILPVVLSLIICTVLSPIASNLRKLKVPSALASIISILLFIFVVGGIFSFVAPDFARQSQSLYLQAVEGIQRLQLWAQGPPLELNSEDIGGYVDEVANWIQQQAGSIAGSFLSGVGTATSLLITLVVMTVMTFFFLKDGHKFLPWIRQATSRRAGWHLTEALTRGWNTLVDTFAPRRWFPLSMPCLSASAFTPLACRWPWRWQSSPLWRASFRWLVRLLPAHCQS